ncbi:MAG: fumarylacetoacetate hydrolase [Pelagibacteraceae bacterium]
MSNINKISSKLTKAFLTNKLISPIPLRFCKNIKLAQKLRVLCESKINKPIIGFKAGGTAIPVLKKLKEKEPFYASIFKHNFIKSGKKVKINKYTLGIELEVCYLIKKNFFSSKKNVTVKNVSKYISHVAPCIEVVGYRQKKIGLKFLGDICSDFGANVKFLIGSKKPYKKINIGNLKTIIKNQSAKQLVRGNTNTVYINPLNSCKFVLNKIRKDKIILHNDFYVFTGSTVGVVPIKKGFYTGSISKIGSVKAQII